MRFLLVLFSVGIFVGCSKPHTNSGDQYFANGEYQKAIDYYNNYLQENPVEVKTLYNRGRSYEELGDVLKAETDFLEVLRIEANNANALLSMSKIRYQQSNYAQASLFAEKVIDLSPNSAQAYFLSARSKHQLGYSKVAMEHYSLAISSNKEFGEAYLYRGALKIGLKQEKGACDDFRQAKNLNTEGAEEALSKYCK